MRLTVLLYGKALIYKICWSPFSLLVQPHVHLLSLSLILLETSACVFAVFSFLEWPSLTNQAWLVFSAPAGLSWWFYLQSHLFSLRFLFFLPSQSFSLVLKTFLVAQLWRIHLQYRRCRRHWFDIWVSPWRRKWQPTPVFLPGKSHRQRSLVGHSPWGCKELDMTEWLSMPKTKKAL